MRTWDSYALTFLVQSLYINAPFFTEDSYILYRKFPDMSEMCSVGMGRNKIEIKKDDLSFSFK